jgi:hypothetical protein
MRMLPIFFNDFKDLEGQDEIFMSFLSDNLYGNWYVLVMMHYYIYIPYLPLTITSAKR